MSSKKEEEHKDIGNKFPFKISCPVCNNQIKEPIKAYHVKPIPNLPKDSIPQCEMQKCNNKGIWNVNNGHVICQKHLIDLALSTGLPIFIIAKSLVNENKKT